MENNETVYINYSELVDNAMRNIAKDILKEVQKNGLRGSHYFLITFETSMEEVEISNRLKKKYSDEMTIILQHQFEDLDVFEEYFIVKLSFEGIKETIKIPFDALTAIVDPSTKFALQFNTKKEKIDKTEQKKVINQNKDKKVQKQDNQKNTNLENENKVLILDNFRNKKSDE